ncbi:cytochrome c4 precursor [mine drainage metagenome]|uniref:Cytochrome c4 n=1 Tax=mine drainage metagenome TaxID=410659 RepID=A0A1J5RBU8_9ZZZZ
MLARGRALAAACAACHGVDGNATAEAFPKLAGQHAAYLAQQLAAFKAGAAPGAARRRDAASAALRMSPVMNAQAAALSVRDMQDLAAYYAAQPLRAAYATDAAAAGRGARIWRGGIAQRQVPACAACHGAAGAGLPPRYPRLAGQWAGYLREQLAAYARGARGADTPMHTIAAGLDAGQIRDLAEFASGLR